MKIGVTTKISENVGYYMRKRNFDSVFTNFYQYYSSFPGLQLLCKRQLWEPAFLFQEFIADVHGNSLFVHWATIWVKRANYLASPQGAAMSKMKYMNMLLHTLYVHKYSYR